MRSMRAAASAPRVLLLLLLQVLELPENRAIKQGLSDAVGRLTGKAPSSSGLLGKVAGLFGSGSTTGGGASSNGTGGADHVSPAQVLLECRTLAMKVVVSKPLRDDLAAAMKTAGGCSAVALRCVGGCGFGRRMPATHVCRILCAFMPRTRIGSYPISDSQCLLRVHPDLLASALATCVSTRMLVVILIWASLAAPGSWHLAGIPVPENEERWRLALDALRGVWASKYNDR